LTTHNDTQRKVALVTGSAQGLGKWISLGLAHAGADVAVADLNKEGADQTAKEIVEMGCKALLSNRFNQN